MIDENDLIDDLISRIETVLRKRLVFHDIRIQVKDQIDNYVESSGANNYTDALYEIVNDPANWYSARQKLQAYIKEL